MEGTSFGLYSEAMKSRHSVRQYTDEPLSSHDVSKLRTCIDSCNGESGLRFQLVIDEPDAFGGLMAHYGTFRGVKNYVALVGKGSSDLERRCGYYGEKIVLEAQSIGLNTCWVALTYRKIPNAFSVLPDEKLVSVIALGKGANQGKSRRSKRMENVSSYEGQAPDWFVRGVEAALLAPTAMNQQRFKITGAQDKVSIRPGIGPCTRIDVGIVQLHFEYGAYPHPVLWV